MLLSPAGLMAYCESTGEPRFSPNLRLTPGPARLLAGLGDRSQASSTRRRSTFRNVFPAPVSAAILGGVLLASFVLQPFAYSAVDDSPAASRIDANKLAREVMENELAAPARDQSLWRFHEIREKNGEKKLYEVCQTKNGEINRLVAVNGKPLIPALREAEDRRIHKLLTNPSEMQRELKKQREDAQQAKDLMKLFPEAFKFQYAGTQGNLVKLTFAPNPSFHPPNHAALVFHHMKGNLLVDAKQKRLAEINGELTTEVKFGGGILGHLDKGGTFVVKQQDVGSGHWEMTLMDVRMNGKALFFKNIDVVEKDIYADFQPVTDGITFQKAAELLAANASSANVADPSPSRN
jgi:hypothetical protein